jgi:CRISPR-associated protein Cmr3
MITWLIEPHDPLIVRDGRPFDSSPGARAHTLPFPFPATVAGAIRHKAGLTTAGTFNPSLIAHVQQIDCQGPILVALKPQGTEISDWYAPAPADTLLFDQEPTHLLEQPVIVRQLVPNPTLDPTLSNLDNHLMLMSQRGNPTIGKPSQRAPRFWSWQALEQWLTRPSDPWSIHPNQLGLGNLPIDTRTHVSIERASQTAAEGRLFQTSGLVFEAWEQRLALVAWTSKTAQAFPHFTQGHAAFGGERRLAHWRTISWSLPPCPAAIRQAILRHQRCRIQLLTPACFTDGLLPNQLPTLGNTAPIIRAVVNTRYQVISGWDLESNRPRPTRRLVPAGSVYFVELPTTDQAAITTWIDTVWGQAISDTQLDRHDGFGIAMLGSWETEGA